MIFGEATDGAWEIEGTDRELRDLILTLQDAIEEGEAEGQMLSEDGVIPVRVTATVES